MSHRREPRRFDGKVGQDPGDEMYVELGPGQDGKPVRMVFCWCPKAEDPERARSDAFVASGFWLAKHPVNQAQYRCVMGSNPSRFGPDDRRPVETVSWNDAQAFCKTTTRQKEACLGWRLRLPSEVMWEYACRAGGRTDAKYGVGDGYSLHAQWANFHGGHPVDAFKWVDRRTTVVEGCFPPNAWGLHDMHGQVWEWCEDAQGGGRALRGGSWIYLGWYAESSYRRRLAPDSRKVFIGFRPSPVPPAA